MPALISAFALLRNNPVVTIVGIVLVIVGLALLYQTAQVYSLRLKLAQKENAIVQLQGAITNQNDQILAWKQAGDEASKQAQAALRSAQAGKAVSEKTITAILNRRLSNPLKACEEADALILEFAR